MKNAGWIAAAVALGIGGYVFVKKGGLIVAKLGYDEIALRIRKWRAS